jgi:23S rRNA (cytosine1962-C5)-methyltransferase
MSRAAFDDVVVAAAADSGRPAQVLERRGASADHPELAGVPETGYLKCWLLRAL